MIRHRSRAWGGDAGVTHAKKIREENNASVWPKLRLSARVSSGQMYLLELRGFLAWDSVWGSALMMQLSPV